MNLINQDHWPQSSRVCQFVDSFSQLIKKWSNVSFLLHTDVLPGDWELTGESLGILYWINIGHLWDCYIFWSKPLIVSCITGRFLLVSVSLLPTGFLYVYVNAGGWKSQREIRRRGDSASVSVYWLAGEGESSVKPWCGASVTVGTAGVVAAEIRQRTHHHSLHVRTVCLLHSDLVFS